MPLVVSNLNDFLETLCCEKNSISKAQRKKLEKAQERAYDMLKFEMDLYWKRASYFWGLTAIAFTAYFIVADTSKFVDRPELKTIVNSIGLVFSFALYLVNRGSKFWQNNWHFIIVAIEELLGMPVSQFKRIHQRHILNPLGAYPFSFSDLHHITSLYITLIWTIIYAISIKHSIASAHWAFFTKLDGMVVILTIIVLGSMLHLGKTKSKDSKVSFDLMQIVKGET